MFSKSNKPQSGRGERSVPSIIAADCRIVGDIVSQGEVQVDGQVEGDMRCTSLVVGESGSITGEIIADHLKVYGSITGLIRGQAVELFKTARVVGDIFQDSLSVAAGAFVQGRCERLNAESPTALPDRNPAGQALLSKPQAKNAAKEKPPTKDAETAEAAAE